MTAVLFRFLGQLLSLLGYLHKKGRKYYSAIWEPSTAIKETTILGLRGQAEYGYRPGYYSRDTDTEILRLFNAGKHFLVTGNPLAGKSRAILQLFRMVRAQVLIPNPNVDKFGTEDLEIPRGWSHLGQKVAFLDDLEKYAVRPGFGELLRQLVLAGDILVIATCRKGMELGIARGELERQNMAGLFTDIDIPKFRGEKVAKVAETAGEVVTTEFDGNIGSLFVPLHTIKGRWRDCGEEDKGILRCIKTLYACGIYEGNERFDAEHISALFSQRFPGHGISELAFRDRLEALAAQCFFVMEGTWLEMEQTYLEKVVEGE